MDNELEGGVQPTTPPDNKPKPNLRNRLLHSQMKGFDYQPAMKADNTVVVNPLVPKNNSQQEIKRSKNAVSANQEAQAKDAYYNPEVKPNITSGDPNTDFLYRNQWLINTPIIGDYIKNKAYDIATHSGGRETLTPNQIADINKGKTPTYEDFDGQVKPIKGYKGEALNLSNGEDKINLLDQYFNKIDLPSSAYKPTSDYLPFLPSKSIKGKFDQKNTNRDMSDWIKYITNTSAALSGDELSKLDYNKKPIYLQEKNDSPITKQLGVNLNGHKLSINFDKERNLPYISVSDAWDFSPKDYSEKNGFDGAGTEDKAYIQASLMHKAGTPFKVYDRFYFDPKTHKYIPDDKVPVLK